MFILFSHGAAFAFNDSKGEKLNGKNNYTITFDIDNLPPVTEFWSIPMYDATLLLMFGGDEGTRFDGKTEHHN